MTINVSQCNINVQKTKRVKDDLQDIVLSESSHCTCFFDELRFSSLCPCTWSWIKRRCSLMLPCLSSFISDLGLQPGPRTVNYSKTLLASLEISVFSPVFAASNQHFSHVWKQMKKKRFQGAESPLFSCRSYVPNPLYFCNSVAVLGIVLLL